MLTSKSTPTLGITSTAPSCNINAISSAEMVGCSWGLPTPSQPRRKQQIRLSAPNTQKDTGQPNIGLPANSPDSWKAMMVPA